MHTMDRKTHALHEHDDKHLAADETIVSKGETDKEEEIHQSRHQTAVGSSLQHTAAVQQYGKVPSNASIEAESASHDAASQSPNVVDPPLRRLQLEELRLTKHFVEICDQLGLRPYMLGGTLLGAVRHQGFIPWDDDVDMCLMRHEYDRFLKHAPQLLHPGITLEHLDNSSSYRHVLAKLTSSVMQLRIKANDAVHDEDVWIDIIPLDGWPASKGGQLMHKLRICWCKLLNVLTDFDYAIDTHRDRGTIGNVLVSCLRILSRSIKPLGISHQHALKKLDRALRRYSSRRSARVINIPAARGFRELFDTAWFGEGILLPFEDTQLLAPQQYHEVLTAIYGPDYLTPPPVQDRNWHNSEVIDEA